MSAKHTPGPWWLDDRRLTHPQSGAKAGGGGLLILGAHAGPDSSFCVAKINDHAGGKEADAYLIAAAPDLLAALVLLRADVAGYPAWERPCHALDVADAAIALASGQQ